MSIQAVSYVLQYSKTKLWDRLVLIALANHANDRALSWPAVQTIAHEAGIGERTTQRALRRLEALGEISPSVSRSLGGRKSTEYLLSGYEEWRRSVSRETIDVGPPTRENNGGTSRKTHANRTFLNEKRQDKGQKHPNTPPGRHPTPANGDTPPPPRVTPLNALPDTPGVTRETPEPSLNLAPQSVEGSAAALAGGAAPLPTLSHNDPEPDDPEALADVFRAMAAIAERPMPRQPANTFRSPELREDLDRQAEEAERQKRALAESGRL